MTMHIQIVVPKETPDNYQGVVSIIENEEVQETITLNPGEVSPQICIYDGKYVKVKEIENPNS